MKRSITRGLAVGILAAATLGVTACSSNPSSSAGGAASAGPQTVTMWGSYGNGGNSTQQDALNKQLIPAFEKANPGITVKYVDIPYASLLQKLTTSAAGGTLPDLVRSDIGWVPQLASLGVVAPLSEKLSGFSKYAAAVYPGTLATNKYQGKYYGLPLDTNTRVLITDGAALKKAGMTAPPTTFAELKAMAAKLKGTGMSVFADSGLGQWNVFPWIWSNGGEVTNSTLTKATGYLDGPKSVAAVQMLVALYKEKQIPNLIIGNQGATSTSDGLPKVDYATILDGPWMKGIWSGQYPKFKPIYSPVPAGEGPSTSVVGGEDIVLTSTSKHQQAAENFIAFTQSKQFQLAMAKTGQMTVVPAYESDQAAIDPYYSTFSAQLKTAKARLAIPQAAKVDGILSAALTPAFQGKVSVQAALTTAAQQIDPLLTQAK
jgi:multiple sugar transport system substrate-binding protein